LAISLRRERGEPEQYRGSKIEPPYCTRLTNALSTFVSVGVAIPEGVVRNQAEAMDEAVVENLKYSAPPYAVSAET
jgi:hypothetical protein